MQINEEEFIKTAEDAFDSFITEFGINDNLSQGPLITFALAGYARKLMRKLFENENISDD